MTEPNDADFWATVADGVSHDPRCERHFAGAKGWVCLRCQIEDANRDRAQAAEAIRKLTRCLFPVELTLAEQAAAGEPYEDEAAVMYFNGSGASDRVTAGEVRAALTAAWAAVARLEHNANEGAQAAALDELQRLEDVRKEGANDGNG